MKELPRRKDYYSLSAQGTRDEVNEGNKSFINFRINEDEKAIPPGFRRKHPLKFTVQRWICFENKGDQLYLRFGKSRGDEVERIEVEIQKKRCEIHKNYPRFN